jgi:hypothetical protein
LNRDVIPNLDFVLARHGREAEESIEGQKAMRAASRAGDGGLRAAAPRLRSLRRLARGLWRLRAAGGRARLREAMLQRLLGEEYQALQLGRFRRSGEIHQWMYDGYSLSRALIRAGFVEPRTRRPDESRVGNWAEIGLDADGSGRPVKPDSIVVEAIKPAGPGAGAR